MKPALLATLAIAVSLVAGCVEGPAQPSTIVTPTDGTTASFQAAGDGALDGRVVDDEVRPVGGAQVELAGTGLSTNSGVDGSFRIERVPVGAWTLRVSAAGHGARELRVSVAQGETTRVQVILPVLASAAPYLTTAQFEGHYTCAHEIPIWTGDCMLLYESETGENDTVTTEAYAFRTLVGPGWESVVVELAWTYASNNQLDGMRLYLENGNGTDTGHSYKVGRADGRENPLTVRVHRGEAHPRADYYEGTAVPAFIPDEGEEVQLRVFPRGMLYEHTSQVCSDAEHQTGCFLGVGVGIDVRFTVYASVFYGQRAPETYSAIA